MSEDPLVEAARAAALRAHAPYSGFHVGCAIEALDGRVVSGANMENACYRLGVCAEISALTAAMQAFGLGSIARIAVVAGRPGPGGTLTGSDPVTPCGGCRQSIAEAAAVAGRDLPVLCVSADGTARRSYSLSALLPHAFGPADLG